MPLHPVEGPYLLLVQGHIDLWNSLWIQEKSSLCVLGTSATMESFLDYCSRSNVYKKPEHVKIPIAGGAPVQMTVSPIEVELSLVILANTKWERTPIMCFIGWDKFEVELQRNSAQRLSPSKILLHGDTIPQEIQNRIRFQSSKPSSLLGLVHMLE
ncbi:hypothetical protein C8R48DRAFT_674000 [Suillus tomentosus]|nr:hypothetical protein C8R48DRAFT_674000 [Suillus tomentosus]